MTNPLKEKRVTDIAAWLLLPVLMTVILKQLSFLFIPLSIAVLIVYVLGFPLDYLKQYKVPGYARIGIVVLFVLVIFYLIGRLVSVNIEEFQNQLPALETKFWEYARWGLASADISQDQAREIISSFFRNIGQEDIKPLGNILQKVSGSFFSFLGNLIWVLLFMVFILAERDKFSHRLLDAFGEEKAGPIRDSFLNVNKAVQHYLGLKTLVSFITGALAALILWLFDVPFALLWGVLTFLLNYIPNIGSLVATIPPVAIALFESGSIGKTLVIALILTSIQMTVGNIIEPKVMGKGLNLSPLVVILSLIFWGWMWGITGMFVSVPLTAALKIGLEQLDSTRPIAILMSGGK